MKKYTLLILLFIIAVFLELYNIYLLNKVTTDSIYAPKIQGKISSYEESNMVLKTEILKYSSINMIASRASDLGFVEPKQYISFYAPLTVAVRK